MQMWRTWTPPHPYPILDEILEKPGNNMGSPSTEELKAARIAQAVATKKPSNDRPLFVGFLSATVALVIFGVSAVGGYGQIRQKIEENRDKILTEVRERKEQGERITRETLQAESRLSTQIKEAKESVRQDLSDIKADVAELRRVILQQKRSEGPPL